MKSTLDSLQSFNKTTTRIKRSQKIYWGLMLLCTLFMLSQSLKDGNYLSNVFRSLIGILPLVAILFALYKILFNKGDIIFTDSSFKVSGYDWETWDELVTVYPFMESDSEGEQHYIHFRLVNGTDYAIRSETLSMSFEQIAELVNKYKTEYQNKN